MATISNEEEQQQQMNEKNEDVNNEAVENEDDACRRLNFDASNDNVEQEAPVANGSNENVSNASSSNCGSTLGLLPLLYDEQDPESVALTPTDRVADNDNSKEVAEELTKNEPPSHQQNGNNRLLLLPPLLTNFETVPEEDSSVDTDNPDPVIGLDSGDGVDLAVQIKTEAEEETQITEVANEKELLIFDKSSLLDEKSVATDVAVVADGESTNDAVAVATPTLETITSGVTPTVVTITTATSSLFQQRAVDDSKPTPTQTSAVAVNSNDSTLSSSTVVDDVTSVVVEPIGANSGLLPHPMSVPAFVGVNASYSNASLIGGHHNYQPLFLPPSSSNKTNPNNNFQQQVHHWQPGGNNNLYAQPQSVHYAHPSAVLRPRHCSGNNLQAPPGLSGRLNNGGVGGSGSHLGFAGGGSERELSSELTKENIKRWSLAGTSPEIALLRVKLEDVQRELSDLRSKHECKLNDYQNVLRQLEFCQETKNQLETELKTSRTEILRLKNDYDRLLQQKQLLDRQVIDLQLKLQRKQGELDEILVGRPNTGDLTRKLMEEYEDIRLDREKLKDKCREFEADCDELRQTLIMAQDESRTMQIQYESELEAQRIKIESLEHRQIQAYQQLHKMAQDRDMLRSDREILRQQWEESCANATRFQNILQKREDDLHILQRKHDGVFAEYHRVMSERDSVLKENERLSDEKTSLLKKFKSSDSDRQALLEQLRTREIQISNLQQELDDYRRQIVVKVGGGDDVNILIDSRQSSSAMTVPVGQANSLVTSDIGSPTGTYSEQRSIASSEDEVAMITSRAQEEKMDEMRRRIDMLKEQFDSSRQEIDSAKQQRDWALDERQRIVAERDSIRVMSDTLRRERDDAITKLAAAIRDTDELNRQKEQAERELKKLKERLELDLKPKIQTQDTSPSHSRDSAIDTDMAEWEIETLELNMNGSQRNEDLGVELRGGRDDLIYGTTVPVYVKAIVKGSKLDGILKPFDCIMQVNNVDVANTDRRFVMDILKNCNSVKMVIKRRRLIGMKLISVPLDSNGDDDVGVFFEDGVYVTRIKTSSLAAKAGNLAVGDRLVYVNDIPVHGKTASEVHELVQSHKGCGLVLAVMKSPPVLSPMTPSASLPGSFSNNNNANNRNNMKSSNCGNGLSFNNQTFTSQQQTKQSPSVRDEAAQTSSISDIAATTYLPPPKKESLLEKVHDKFFGKSDKKTAIRASVSIPNEVVDLVRGTSSATRFRVHPHSGSSERAANRYRTSSVCSSVSSSVGSGSVKGSSSAEQQVLQQLNSILEASEKEITNRGLTKILNAEKGGSGGTWPKYRPSPLVLSGNNNNVSSTSKKTNERKSVFPVIASTLSQQQQQQDEVTVISQSNTPSLNTNVAGTCLRSTSSQQSRLRSPEMRPMSYHPSVTSGPKYMNYDEISTPNSPPAVRNFVDLPLSSPSHHHFYDSTLLYGNVHSRPSSAQSRAGRQVISQYEPYGHNHSEGQPAAMVINKTTQPLHMAMARPVLPSHSRYPPVGGLFSLMSTGPCSSAEQDLDTSQSSVNRLLGKPCYVPKYSMKSGSVSPSNSLPTDYYPQTKLSQGDVRTVCIEKRNSHESLGIRIAPSKGQGVFVSLVNENSLAAKHGLQVGDQILEVCGINLRLANLNAASSVLSQLGRSEQITMRVQYNPERYFKEAAGGDYQYSATSTPRATPNSLTGSGFTKSFLSRESSLQSTNTQHSRELLTSADCTLRLEPRFVFVKKEGSGWGFTLIGGNAIGIFVDDLKTDSGAASEGLREGDQVLEFDGINFRKLTLEQALSTLERPCDSTVSILAQYNSAKYQRCKTGAGDSFYVRVLIDRQSENNDELSYKSGDILRVDNTVFNGVTGLWRAWLVDQEGRERSCGIIPSKTKLEEEFIFKRSGSEISAGDGSSEGGGSRRGTIRRSLKFIRRSSRTSQSHQRTPSKDSRDLQDTDTIIADELYQRVERLDYKKKRPVLILGALTDVFVSKLLEDYPHIFVQCVPECVKPDVRLEQNLLRNIYVDYRKRDKLYEITTVAAVKDIVDKGFHCILHVSLAAIERLHQLQIYPVVVFVKFKNSKQIKEISEDRVSSKQAKEFLEVANRLENEHHHLFSSVIQAAHNNVKFICQQIACAVEHEQKKTLWIVSNETL